MLVKGPVALLILPALVAFELGLRWLGRPEAPGRPADALRLTLVAVVAPLAYLAYLHHLAARPLLRQLRADLLVRATRGIDPGHLHGPAYHLVNVGADFGWWLLLALPALVAVVGRPRRLVDDGDETGARARRRTLLLAACWAATVLVLFSLPASKLPWYVFPAYPAVALLIAGGAAVLAPRLPRLVRAFAATALAAALLMGLVASWSRAGQAAPPVPEQRLARAIEATGAYRLVVKRGARFDPEAAFYLQPLGTTVWRIPRRFWREDGACRFVLRGSPWSAAAGGTGPRSLPVPGGPPGRSLWLIDVDRCLDPAAAARK
jgi:4-amino-4-deoxy-L-arabinose transferase-like glycosyltransferase